jgi:hypothetical protein
MPSTEKRKCLRLFEKLEVVVTCIGFSEITEN